MTEPSSPDDATIVGRHEMASAARITIDPADYERVLDVLWLHRPAAVAEDVDAGSITFTVSYPSADALSAVVHALGPSAAHSRPVDDTDWVAAWRASARPLETRPFWVRLPEHPVAPTGLIDLVIDPGPSFGFAHASTTLALRLLATTNASSSGPVADVGCGSGVLAIAAAKLGAPSVDAIDIDTVAVDVAAANTARNDVRVRCGQGSADTLTPAHYTLVVANLTATTLRALHHELIDLLVDDGQLVVSGLLSTQQDAVRAGFAALELLDQVSLDDWVALRFGR